MAAPDTFNVEQVVSVSEPWAGKEGQMITYELLLAERPNQTFKAHLPASESAPTLGEIKGWVNDNGKFGVATGKPSGARTTSQTGSSNGRRDDATGQSIERQVAAKAAAEMAVAAGGDAPTLIANFEAYFDIVAGKIAGVPVLTPDAS